MLRFTYAMLQQFIEEKLGSATFSVPGPLVGIFGNDVTPTLDSVVGDFALAGLFDTFLTINDPVSFSRDGLYAVCQYGSLTFTNSSEATDCYGYFVVSNDSTTLLWAERFEEAPLTVPAPGTLILTPKATMANEDEVS